MVMRGHLVTCADGTLWLAWAHVMPLSRLEIDLVSAYPLPVQSLGSRPFEERGHEGEPGVP